MLYVVSLRGKHVFSGFSIQGVMKDLSDLELLRAQLKKEHGLVFSNESSARIILSSYLIYDNITDKRDIKLVVERTYFI